MIGQSPTQAAAGCLGCERPDPAGPGIAMGGRVLVP